MRVLLIQPPIEDFYTTPIRLYPLGLLYAAATLQRLGHQVAILDALHPLKKRTVPVPNEFSHLVPWMKQNPYFFKHYYRFGISDQEILARVEKIQPDLIGISANFTAYFKNVAELVHLLKRHFSAPVILGGNHATVFADEIRERLPEIDGILPGPVESSVYHYFDDSPSGIDMDWRQLLPPHEILPADLYRIGKNRAISLTASRGCPFHCEFCSVHAMFGRKMSFRSPDSVFEEIKQNYQRRNVRIFNFEDDNLTVHRDWFLRLLDRILASPELKGIELTAMNGLCYTELDGELLEKMKQSGFSRLDLSWVTQDPMKQRLLGRPQSRNDNRDHLTEVVRQAKKLGFFVTVYIILGLPDQTFEEIQETIDFLRELDVLIGPSVFYLPPGSSLFEKLEIPDTIRSNWNLYRSSAFAIETEHLTRNQLVELFCQIRQLNLAQRERLRKI